MKIYKTNTCILILLFVRCVSGYAASELEVVLEKMTHGRMDERMYVAESISQNAHQIFLSNKYLPPSNLKYVFCPAQSGEDMDMVKIRYAVEEEVFSITQTKHVFVITVAHDGKNTTSDQKRSAAEAIARRIFRNGSDIVLEKKDERDGWVFGVCLKKDRDEAVWLDVLKWWSDQDLIGFTFPKKYSLDPSPYIGGYAPLFNQYWFTKGAGKGGQSER